MATARKSQDSVSFTVSPADAAIIDKIIDRYQADAKKHGVKIDRLSSRMDITACHANGNPLRLADLLAADDFNFCHDVFGIEDHLDRSTGKLLHHFSPRFSAPEPESAAA